MTGWKGASIVGVLILMRPTAIDAQSVNDRLAAVRALDCRFTLKVVATWNKGVPQVEQSAANLALKFESVNAEDGTARVVGMFGPSDIIVRLSEHTLHLMQSFREGPLYTTTVFPKESRTGRLQAVHTRHELTDVSLPGYTSSPEQYYGDCQVSP